MGTWFARGKTSIVGRVIAGFFRETRGLAGAIVWVGLTIVLAIIMLSVLAPVLAPFDPSRKVANPETPPGGPFLMGTDRSGQDVFSRILWGGRVPLQVIVLSTLISLAVGVPLGLFSGFLGGRFDRVVVLVMDSVYAFPGLLLAIAIAAVIGRGILNISAAIAVVYIPTYFRVIRNHVSSVRSELYVDAAVALGIPKWRVIGKYVLPNVAQNIPVIFSTNAADAVLTEAALTFLGLGLPAGIPDWGFDISLNWQRFDVSWWATFEGLNDILNPLLRKVRT